MTEVSLDSVALDEDLASYIVLELGASAPLARYVYRDLEVARRIHTELVVAGEGEFAAPYGRLLRDQAGVAVAMYTAPFARLDLASVRGRAVRALSRSDTFRADPAFRKRMSATRELFVVPGDGDAYLSRIGVAQAHRTRGIGQLVFALFRAECEVRRASRIVLECAAEHEAAQRFYRRLGFRETARRTTSDTALVYAHLALDLQR